MTEKILLRQYVPLEAYKPRVYLNGFPKAGLHMLEQMVGLMVGPSTVGMNGTRWLGTYKWNSWSMQWQDLRRYLWRLSCLERGTYLMGHSGHHKKIERLLRYANIGHIFLYRDLRAIAVSQAHHIWDEDQPFWQHEHKDLYRMLGSYDAVLMAVIEGLGPYPGVVERWAEYAPWLKSKHALHLTYRELHDDLQRSMGRIVLYLLNNATALLEGNQFKIEMDPEDIKRLAERAEEVTGTHSTTFRRGVVDSWRDEFKPEHVEAFKRSDVDGWLIKLGFETNPDWRLENVQHS